MSEECDGQHPSEQSRVTKDIAFKLKVSAVCQVGLISKYTEVAEASEALVSTMAYHIIQKQYD